MIEFCLESLITCFFFYVFHPEVLREYNMSVNNTTLYLHTIEIVYCQGDMFRPLLGHLQAL